MEETGAHTPRGRTGNKSWGLHGQASMLSTLPRREDGKANTVSQGSVWILTFLCNLCHCGKSLNLSSLQCFLLKAEINIQQTLTKHLSWTSTCCFWYKGTAAGQVPQPQAWHLHPGGLEGWSRASLGRLLSASNEVVHVSLLTQLLGLPWCSSG